MKLLSLCLGLTLVWAHEEGNHEVVTSNIDLSKISGDWYTVLLASDKKERIDENGDLRIFLEHIQALDSSSVLLRYHTKKNGQCTEFSIVGEDTDQDGVYSVFYEGHNRFSIIEAIYGEYAICHTVNFNNGKITQVMELFGHEPDLNDQIKRRFKEICQKYEVHHILDLTNVALTSDLQIELSDLPVVSQLGKWPLSFPIVSYLRCIVGLHSDDVWEGCSNYGCVTAE